MHQVARLPAAHLAELLGLVYEGPCAGGEVVAIARAAGLPADSGLPQLPLYLRTSGPGFCLHEPIETHSPRAAALLDWARSLDADALPGDNLVHVDFQPSNVLVHRGESAAS